jgi:hypothetical protein
MFVQLFSPIVALPELPDPERVVLLRARIAMVGSPLL